MRLGQFRRCTFALSLVVGFVCLIGVSVAEMEESGRGLQASPVVSPSASTIILSDVDTLRILDQFAAVGDTFALDLYVVNVDTLGAYSIRLRYDPLVIEPLTDTVVDLGDTVYTLELEQLRGTAFEEFDGSVNEPGVLTMLAADFDLDTIEAFAPGAGVSARMMWRVLPLIDTQTVVVGFEIHPELPQSFNVITDFHGTDLIRPVLTDGRLRVLPGPCDCPFQGDLDANFVRDAVDLNLLVDALFFGGDDPAEPTCPVSRMDWNCDGFADAVDLNLFITGIFFVPAPPCDPCNEALR
ncbi:MAG: hypothetical protein Kow0074_08590 [Candidatus Zixiibacteriota bacterium]